LLARELEALAGEGGDAAVEREVIEHTLEPDVAGLGDPEAGSDLVDVERALLGGEEVNHRIAARKWRNSHQV